MGNPSRKAKVVAALIVKKELPEKMLAYAKKYRYPILILLVGIFLAIWPFGKKSMQAPAVRNSEQLSASGDTKAVLNQGDYCKQTEEELCRILSQIDGAGKVRVMLTLHAGTETVYQMNIQEQSQTEDSTFSAASNKETVILSRGSSYNEPAVVKERYPVFRGALIVSEGGGNASVRYELSKAVSALLGIGTDQITVVKMK